MDGRGVFLLSFSGRSVGTEKFNIHFSSQKIEAESETQLKVEQNGQSIDVKSTSQLVLSPHFEPQTYKLDEKGSQPYQLTVDFRSSPAQSRLRLGNGKEDNRDLPLATDIAILDDNVVHHYQLLVDRFSLTPAAKQFFNGYIPQEAAVGVLTLEEFATEEVELAGRKASLRHLMLSTDQAKIDLWVDNQQRVQKVSNPLAQFEAVRQE